MLNATKIPEGGAKPAVGLTMFKVLQGPCPGKNLDLHRHVHLLENRHYQRRGGALDSIVFGVDQGGVLE